MEYVEVKHSQPSGEVAERVRAAAAEAEAATTTAAAARTTTGYYFLLIDCLLTPFLKIRQMSFRLLVIFSGIQLHRFVATWASVQVGAIVCDFAATVVFAFFATHGT
jgi:hypothetical protein